MIIFRFAGNKCALRDVADRFGIAASSGHSICTRIMLFLYDLAPNVIKFPETPEEKIKISEEFFKVN